MRRVRTTMTGSMRMIGAPWVALLMVGCGGSQKQVEAAQTVESVERATPLSGLTAPIRKLKLSRCDAIRENRELKEYDTNNDMINDVRKVFILAGAAPAVRRILICREADIDHDMRKDVIRYYDDEGRAEQEEADRDFDGKIDSVTFFEDGAIAREEADLNRDGWVDIRTYYEDGHVIRTERDLARRSRGGKWKPDRWEYFEEGRLVRMGSDLDGDGKVDRWDRDFELKPKYSSSLLENQAVDRDEAYATGTEKEEDSDDGAASEKEEKPVEAD